MLPFKILRQDFDLRAYFLDFSFLLSFFIVFFFMFLLLSCFLYSFFHIIFPLFMIHFIYFRNLRFTLRFRHYIRFFFTCVKDINFARAFCVWRGVVVVVVGEWEVICVGGECGRCGREGDVVWACSRDSRSD